MKADSNKANDIICTYWGTDNRNRIFDIIVDSVKVATVDLNKFKAAKFYEITYPIPEIVTKNKQQVQVTFKAVGNNHVGPVYGVRMVSEEDK